MDKHIDYTKCINCKLCTKHCSFLTKYNISIGDINILKDLAYNCFLCGECTRVCPKNIDGKQIILNMRVSETNNKKYKLKQKGYSGILIEKRNYIFKNYSKAKSKALLFTGCNFPSFFPITTSYISKLLKALDNIDTVYDCCGKPIAELGLDKDENRILTNINNYIEKNDIKELILICPNCYYHFGNRLNVKIKTIYEKLYELGIGERINFDFDIFLPCPDRENKKWLEFIMPFINSKFNYVKNVQCCGLGGCAVVKEKTLALDMPKKLKNENHNKILTYCGTCAGNFYRQNCTNVSHFLPIILGTNEVADTKYSWLNRLKTKFI